jgi:hypothetical protein
MKSKILSDYMSVLCTFKNTSHGPKCQLIGIHTQSLFKQHQKPIELLGILGFY